MIARCPSLVCSAALALFAAGPSLALAQPVVVPIDESASFIEVTLSVSGFTDSDSSPVTGSVTVDPADPDFPGNLAFYAYDIALTENLTLVLSAGFLGQLTVNINSLVVDDAFNGDVYFAPIIANQFTLVGAPSTLGGTLAYSSTGLFCAAISGAGLPCADTADLADQGVVLLDLSGNVEIVDNIITLSADIDATAPLDPANPSLGTISFTGLIVGSAEIPVEPGCVGDLDDSGGVDSDDLAILLGAFGAGAGGDVDGDGDTDSDDLGLLLGVFGTACD
ncbi:MAG: hypothetical protein ACTS3F_03575 [Phycisphaerales bacterium]